MSDLISRKAAIKAIEDLQDCYNDFSDTYDKACIIGVLEEQPTAERVGKWKRKWHTFFKRELPCCSACGKFEVFERNYCPNCGARLIGEKDD